MKEAVMSIAEMKTMAHQKIEEASEETPERLLSMLEPGFPEKYTSSDEELVEFDRRGEELKSGKVTGMSSEVFWRVVNAKANP